MVDDGTHPLWDRNEAHEIYREWRRVFDRYNPPRSAVAEAWVLPERQYLYARPSELGQTFNFEFAKATWTYDDMHAAIEEGLKAAIESDSASTWVLSNHDVPRVATRYALPQIKATRYHQIALDWLLRDGSSYDEDRELGERRARAALLLELALPGSAYVYQGEELGLFEEIIGVSAKEGTHVENVIKEVAQFMEEGPMYFPDDMITEHPERFVVSEIIREKILMYLQDEVPHGVAVEIEQYKEEEKITKIHAVIYCEKKSHKGMIIGKGGRKLKGIGKSAREEIEVLLGTKVYLELWVKVKENWRDSDVALSNFGYKE